MKSTKVTLRRALPERARRLVRKCRDAVVGQLSGAERHLRALIIQAEAASKSRNWFEAERHWREILQANNQDVTKRASVKLSEALRMLDRSQEAEAVLQKAWDAGPDLAMAVEYARIAMACEDWREAAERWKAVVDQFGDAAPKSAYRQLHATLRLADDDEAARLALKKYESLLSVDYMDWIRSNDSLTFLDRDLIVNHIRRLPLKPKFSLILDLSHGWTGVRSLLDSLAAQIYENWELLLFCGALMSSSDRLELQERASRDKRIRLFFRDDEAGAADCFEEAFEMAAGEWGVFADYGVLPSHSLYLFAVCVNQDPDAAIIYCDHDYIDESGRRSNPCFKPDFNYDFFLSKDLLKPLSAHRIELLRQVGNFDTENEGCESWKSALRLLESAPDAKIKHLPFILFHQRLNEGSGSVSSADAETATRIVNEHLLRTKQAAIAIPIRGSSLRIKRETSRPCPAVSVVIPTKDHATLLRSCIEGLLHRTDYENLEIVVVDNGSRELDAVEALDEFRRRSDTIVIDAPGPFNFSRLVNLGVTSSSGEICLLLNNDVSVLEPDWLNEMVSYAVLPRVGAVGAKLYYGNDTVQHGGIILGVNGVAGHAHRFFEREARGYQDRLLLVQGVSAVTGACMATRREVFHSVGGFNERDLAVSYNDVEFCLRVRQAGYDVVWTPYAELYHYESRSRRQYTTPAEADRAYAERSYMLRNWGDSLKRDPYYNPNLSLESGSFALAEETRAGKPWL